MDSVAEGGVVAGPFPDPVASAIAGVECVGYWELAVSDRSTDWASILWCCYHEGISDSVESGPQ